MKYPIVFVCIIAIAYFSLRVTESEQVQSKEDLIEIITKPPEINAEASTDLEKLVNCLSISTCDTSDEDGGIDVRKKVVEQAQALHEKSKENSKYQEQASAYARFIIQYDDYSYQRAALELMASLPKSDENRLAILEGTKSTLSVHIAELALQELKRYENDHDLFQYISYQIENGPFTISPAVADLAVDFMTPSNYDDFQAILDRLPKGSEAYRNLRSSLRDFYLRVLI